MKLKPLVRIGLILACGFALYVAVALSPFVGAMWSDYSQRIPFEKETWIAAGVTHAEPYRTRMVDDLLDRTDFRGMTREQVVAVIGEPSDTEYFSDWDMVYYLGPERGLFSVDSEWLTLRLDAQGKVSEVAVLRD
jgi:hypothetical protein